MLKVMWSKENPAEKPCTWTLERSATLFLKSYKDAYQSVDIHYTPNPALPVVLFNPGKNLHETSAFVTICKQPSRGPWKRVNGTPTPTQRTSGRRAG